MVWLILSLVWGSTWLFIKVGLADLPPFSFAGLRFLLAAVPLAVFAAIRRPPLPRNAGDWWLMAVTGVATFTVTYGLVFWAEQYISSGLAALLFATFPLFGLVIAHVQLPAERLTRRRVAGVVAGIGGVGIVFSNQLTGTSPLAVWGSAAVVVSALVAAYTDVVIKRRAGHLDPAVLTLVQMIAGAIPLLAIGIVLEGNPLAFRWTPIAWFCLMYLAVVGSALAFVMLYWLIRHMQVTHTMLITLVTPLVAVVLGVLVLDEALTWRTASGGLGILFGVGLTVWRRS